ncbi:hypothetical protein [Ferruginibacter profundus]
MPVAAIDLDGEEQKAVIHYKDQKKITYKIEIRTKKLTKEIVDQNVHQVIKGNQVGGKIAQGYVLVFEVYREGTKSIQMNVVQNSPTLGLNPQEKAIFQSSNKIYENGKKNSIYSYPDNNSVQ